MSDPRLTISVVDDDEPVRKALCRLVGSAGFEAQPFASGRQFLDSLKERCPACAILDVHLPVLSGLDVVQQLKREEFVLPLVMITGRDEPGLRETVRAMGAAFLCKPVEKRVLLETIKRVLGMEQSVKEPNQQPMGCAEPPFRSQRNEPPNDGGPNEPGGQRILGSVPNGTAC